MGLSLEEQIGLLWEAFRLAEQDVKPEVGEEAWEGGGWAEIARAVASLTEGVSAEARSEFLRMQGLAGDGPS